MPAYYFAKLCWQGNGSCSFCNYECNLSDLRIVHRDSYSKIAFVYSLFSLSVSIKYNCFKLRTYTIAIKFNFFHDLLALKHANLIASRVNKHNPSFSFYFLNLIHSYAKEYQDDFFVKCQFLFLLALNPVAAWLRSVARFA